MLTDTACRKAKPTGKRTRIYDTAGMYLEIAPAGGKWWRLKYRFDGKEKRLSLGVYPEVSLAVARMKRDDARRLLHDGIDPSAQRRVMKASAVTSATNTLKNIAEEWLARFEGTWAPSHTRGVKRRLQNDVYPWIGSCPIGEITPPEVLAVLRRIEGRGRLETAHRVRTHLGMIFRFAIATGRAVRGGYDRAHRGGHQTDDRGAAVRDRRAQTPSRPATRRGETRASGALGYARRDGARLTIIVTHALRGDNLRPSDINNLETRVILK